MSPVTKAYAATYAKMTYLNKCCFFLNNFILFRMKGWGCSIYEQNRFFDSTTIYKGLLQCVLNIKPGTEDLRWLSLTKFLTIQIQVLVQLSIESLLWMFNSLSSLWTESISVQCKLKKEKKISKLSLILFVKNTFIQIIFN